MEIKNLQKSQTLREQAVHILRDAVLRGDLLPGTQLVETQLAEDFGISRGPLREALRQLVEERLLENRPYQGTFVKTLVPNEIEEIYSFRITLESFAFELAWSKRDDVFHDEIKHRHQQLTDAILSENPAVAIQAELDLHALVYETSQHSLLFETWTQLRSRLQMYFVFHQRAHGRSGSALDAHDKYVKLALGDELPAMKTELIAHMQRGLVKLRSFFENTKS